MNTTTPNNNPADNVFAVPTVIQVCCRICHITCGSSVFYLNNLITHPVCSGCFNSIAPDKLQKLAELWKKDDLLTGQQSSDVNLATEMKLKKMRGYDLDNEIKALKLDAERSKFYLATDVEQYLSTLGTVQTNILTDNPNP